MSIPHLFRCPISLDLFTDPVTLSTGQTYDRWSIEKWLRDGNSTCPVTMQSLRDKSLVENRTLRHLIDQWLLSVLNLHHPQQGAIGSGTSASLASLQKHLQMQETTVATKIQILKKVRILAVESDMGQASLIQLGYFPCLLQMILEDQSSSDLVEVALDCIVHLSPSTHLESLDSIKVEGNFASFLVLLEQGNAKVKTNLCYLLETIATSSASQDLCLILGKSRRMLQILVSLVQDRNEAAVRAMLGICSLEANIANAIKERAADGLISFLMNSSSPRNTTTTIALATLEILVGNEVGKKDLIRNSNTIQVLVKFVFRVSSKDDQGSEYAIGLLTILCCESSKARADAVNAGVLAQALLLLQSQCGCKAKAKARALLKLLRSLWTGDPFVGGKFYYVM